MWSYLLLVVALVCVTMQSDAARTHKKRYAGYAGSSAGSSAGAYGGSGGYNGYNGYNGGYAGTNNDYDDYGAGFGNFGYGYAPSFGAGFIDPYTFHQQLTAQILAQQAAQQSAIASTFTIGDASVAADASTMPDDIQIQNQVAQQQRFFDNVRRQSHYNNNGRYKGNANRYAPNYAVASGSVGPSGYRQTAYINPENADSPNIDSRFGGDSSSSPGGYKGVSVSSFATSSDIDGKKTGQRGAQTTINDNGKVTTYRVHS